MGVVYHLVPDRMSGTTLWPLAQLAEVDPTAYAASARKYDDRPGAGPPPVTAEDCEPFSPLTLAAASVANEATLTRLADPPNRMPLFVDVIHVLHRGTIQIETAQTVRA